MSDLEDHVRKPLKDKIIVACALVEEALRKEAMRVGVIDFVAQTFRVEQSLEAVNAETTRQRDTYLRVETAQEAAGE